MTNNEIIWPTDFSESSYEALEIAVELARGLPASLRLLHVIAPVPTMPGTPVPVGVEAGAAFDRSRLVADQDQEEGARAALAHIVETRIPEDVEAEVDLLLGRPADEIVDAAERCDARIIVIATHGEGGLKRLLFGSVADKVIRQARCPVLSVNIGGDAP